MCIHCELLKAELILEVNEDTQEVRLSKVMNKAAMVDLLVSTAAEVAKEKCIPWLKSENPDQEKVLQVIEEVTEAVYEVKGQTITPELIKFIMSTAFDRIFGGARGAALN